jgi:hypothetical protein
MKFWFCALMYLAYACLAKVALNAVTSWAALSYDLLRQQQRRREREDADRKGRCGGD